MIPPLAVDPAALHTSLRRDTAHRRRSAAPSRADAADAGNPARSRACATQHRRLRRHRLWQRLPCSTSSPATSPTPNASSPSKTPRSVRTHVPLPSPIVTMHGLARDHAPPQRPPGNQILGGAGAAHARATDSATTRPPPIQIFAVIRTNCGSPVGSWARGPREGLPAARLPGRRSDLRLGLGLFSGIQCWGFTQRGERGPQRVQRREIKRIRGPGFSQRALLLKKKKKKKKCGPLFGALCVKSGCHIRVKSGCQIRFGLIDFARCGLSGGARWVRLRRGRSHNVRASLRWRGRWSGLRR